MKTATKLMILLAAILLLVPLFNFIFFFKSAAYASEPSKILKCKIRVNESELRKLPEKSPK